MFEYFNLPYRDEIIYSTIARLFRHAPFFGFEWFNKEVFGKRHVTMSTHIPFRIRKLVNNTPLGRYFTPEEIILQHTLYPYYSAGLDKDQKRQQMKSALGDRFNMFGLVGGFVNRICQQNLRFCPICMKHDINEYGETYWHRIHQLPGVVICPEHKVFLLEKCSVCGKGLNKLRYEYTALKEYCECGQCLHELVLICEGNNLASMYLEYASDAVKLLNGSKMINRQKLMTNVNKIYRLRGINPGCIKRQLSAEFINYYGESFLKGLGSSISIDVKESWFHRVWGKNGKLNNPVRLSLLDRFFFKNNIPDSSDSLCEIHHFFGIAPWPCLNPAAHHYLHPVISECSLIKGDNPNSVKGRFTCSCGYTYIRVGPQVSDDDRYRADRVCKKGPIWEKRVLELLNSRQYTVKEIAELLFTTIGKIHDFRKHHREKNEKMLPIKVLVDSSKLQHYKDNMLRGIRSDPNATRSKIYKMFGKEYTYIYRREKEWLGKNMPAVKPTGIDWEKRAIQYAKLVKEIADNIKHLPGRPKRVTETNIYRHLKLSNFVFKKLLAIPKFREEMTNNIEAVDDYQVRCIQWAIPELKEENSPIDEVTIRKKMGFHKEFSLSVMRFMQKMTNK